MEVCGKIKPSWCCLLGKAFLMGHSSKMAVGKTANKDAKKPELTNCDHTPYQLCIYYESVNMSIHILNPIKYKVRKTVIILGFFGRI